MTKNEEAKLEQLIDEGFTQISASMLALTRIQMFLDEIKKAGEVTDSGPVLRLVQKKAVING